MSNSENEETKNGGREDAFLWSSELVGPVRVFVACVVALESRKLEMVAQTSQFQVLGGIGVTAESKRKKQEIRGKILVYSILKTTENDRKVNCDLSDDNDVS